MNPEKLRAPKKKKPFLGVNAILLILITSLIGVVAFYICSFYDLKIGGAEAWAQFGDYFGGVSNPLVGLATVLLIIKTLSVTRKEARDTRRELRGQSENLRTQLEILKKDRISSEIKDRLNAVLKDWNVEMEQAPGYLYLPDGTQAIKHSVREVLYDQALLVHIPLGESTNKSKIIDTWRYRFNNCILLLTEMEKYLDEYLSVTESRNSGDFYRNRIQTPLRLFRGVGIVGHNELQSLITDTAQLPELRNPEPIGRVADLRI